MRATRLSCGLHALLGLLATLPDAGASEGAHRVTILYDAFGKPSKMKRDWGFSALVEFGGRRILFDTGNDAAVFANNVAVAGIDLRKLDFAVISHRHLDHTAGLTHLQSVDPSVKIYAPKELGGLFGSALPEGFYRRQESLPAHMRYFGEQPPKAIAMGTPWVGAKFEAVDKTTEVAPGMFLIATVSAVPGTLEMRELSLAIRTPRGLVLIVGCSHPGIETILEAAKAIDPRVHLVLGGFHLPSAPDAEIRRIATSFRDVHKVERLAPGHCTGEPAFAAFQKAWGEDYVYAGLGTVIDLPSR